MHNEYELLDSGDGRKLERFGGVVLSRPCEQALWLKDRPELWPTASACFDREGGWQAQLDAEMPTSWVASINGIALKLGLTPAGHVGVFPETRSLWDWITDTLRATPRDDISVLNLFAYSGGATLAAARAGCSVCHLDASKSMVLRARENAELNGMEEAPIRWIIEDVNKFLDREIRRGRRYDAIMLDPPSFGRGVRGEQYKLDKHLVATLQKCKTLLSENPAFMLLTSHTRGTTPEQLEGLLRDLLGSPGHTVSGEMELTGAAEVRRVPSGSWARWTRP
ncbi:MAG: hypothetical protein CVT67_08335 [Actinobacteria bacterium HGW-Actinobacteria-7]|jgi:23S rRNA (cytosine1962-C5)-methyltransferase|nr:MAG: hypothetical protein CVT67_08335 [Actinobacteria bacterium HGW-Actinobacteria-7]